MVSAWSRVVGRTAAGRRPPRAVHEHGLDNGRMRVAVWTYGATLVEVSVPGAAGGRTNLVVRLPALRHYEERTGRAYVGSTMGRFARILTYGHTEIAGRRHRLALNEGPHHIHGGPEGFDARVWDGSAVGGWGHGRIVLSLTSPDGDQGYPGTLHCTATFELHSDDRLVVRYEAVTDRPTLCGLTLHAFWNLVGDGRVDDHLLAVDAAAVVEAGSDFVPTGRLVPSATTALRTSAHRPLGDTRLDLCVLLGAEPTAPAAVLRHPASGRTLRLHTDQPGLALYTGDHLPAPRAGLCLQPGPLPDAPNQPAFPSALLLPGRTYRHVATYAFSEDDNGAAAVRTRRP
ncbi:aldose epimerase family protein [Streptomyces sp. NPDC056670]|uniref:aldose epimerase family protein n=1 Tax=Streptomyces sp. NPDC056670 TaxID=3345904 RepID=UPI0036A996D7